MPSTKSVLSTAASLAASAMLVRTIANDLMPHQLQNYIFFNLDSLFRSLSSQVTIIIEEFDGFSNNEIYSAAKIYLGNRLSPSSKRLRATKQETEKNMQVSMERNEEIIDLFEGIQLKWRLTCTENRGNVFHSHYGGATIISEARHFELSFHKKHKEKVLGSYLQYILTQSKALKEEKKTVKLHTINDERRYGGSRDAWRSVNLNHPATFETLAMNLEQKRVLMEDLERFVRRKELYRRVGKAWKRGYLLYGPPGTGKSSLIAAMANFLNFDIYDLELTDLRCNSDLRRLLVATANRSILVVEDIDCSLEFKDRQAESTSRQLHPREENPISMRELSQITLSGLLNFIDGLWSSCGDERIIIFTTNHKDKIDPALLRPGRMDVHVHMSYCTPCGFTLLASNYLNIKHHPLFEEIVDLIQEVEITPAQVAEELLKNDDADAALRGLVDFLYGKKSERETTAKEESEASEQVHSGHQIKEEEQIRPC